MMKHNTKYILLASVLALVTAAGCQRYSLIPTGDAIKYEVSVEDIKAKGELVNNNDDNYNDIALAGTLSPFRVAAYNGTSPIFTTSGLDPANVETVSYDGGWKMPNTYYWPQKTVLTFFAYGNLPEDDNTSVVISYTGLTLTHEMVSAVADQKDILLGYYDGLGSNSGTAEIRFWHPLTAVFFRDGGLGDTVKSISLSGLGKSGSVRMNAEGKIGAWTDVAAYTAESSQSDDAGLAVDADTKVIGEPFILIPQDLAAEGGHPVTLTVEFVSGLTLEATISSKDGWASQKTNYYTLSYGEPTGWKLTVTPWGVGASGDIRVTKN